MLDLIFIFALILLIVYVFIRIALRIRKYGGSLTTTMFASTYEFLNKDKRDAVEEIVNMNANIKTEEETSGQSEDSQDD
jgi:hypothetical protein